MTIHEPTIGEYVGRAHPIAATGTYTGVPVTTHGTYVSGVAADRPVGQYARRVVAHRPPA